MTVNDEKKQSNTTRTILIIVGVAVGLLCCLPVAIITLLTLLGPAIGDVFSQISNTLQ